MPKRSSCTTSHAVTPRVLPILISVAMGANVAHAQNDQQQNKAPQLEEVIVTAQKTSQLLQDVPIAVSVLKGGSIAMTGIDNQNLLPQVTPNLQIQASANYSSPYIRGVGTTYANPGLEPSVATYFDDQYFSRASGGLFSFADIDHIEVLKGPQGTLYGRNATGGAIRIITKDPTSEFQAKLGASIGSYGHRGFEGILSGPLTEDLLDRLVVQTDRNDGYVHNIDRNQPNLQDRNQLLVRNKLLWNATDNLTFKLEASWIDKFDHEGQAFLPLYNKLPEQTALYLGGIPSPGFYTATSNTPGGSWGKFHETNGAATLRIDYVAGDITYSSITGYDRDTFYGPADLDATQIALAPATTQQLYTRDLSQEFQAVSDFDGNVNFNSGLFLYDSHATHDFGLGGLAAIGTAAAVDAVVPGLYPNPLTTAFVGGNGAVDIYSVAPYGELYWQFADDWKLTLGARYTKERKTLRYNDEYYSTYLNHGASPGDRNVVYEVPRDTVSFNEFTPKAVISYKPDPDVMLYLSYSKGFKSGGFNLPVPVAPSGIDSVKPEILDAYEFGWKTSFNGRVNFNGALFYYKYKNLQVETVDTSGGGITSVKNAANATNSGAEFDVTFAATENLTLAAGGGYLHTKFNTYAGEEYVPNPAGGLTAMPADLSGNPLPNAPKFTGYLRANYDHPLPAGYGDISANVIYSYTSKFYYTPDKSVSEPSKGLVSAGLAWTSEDTHYTVSLSGQNLTDKKYTLQKTLFASTGGWYVPAPPRNYKLGVTYSY